MGAPCACLYCVRLLHAAFVPLCSKSPFTPCPAARPPACLPACSVRTWSLRSRRRGRWMRRASPSAGATTSSGGRRCWPGWRPSCSGWGGATSGVWGGAGCCEGPPEEHRQAWGLWGTACAAMPDVPVGGNREGGGGRGAVVGGRRKGGFPQGREQGDCRGGSSGGGPQSCEDAHHCEGLIAGAGEALRPMVN